MFKFFLGVVVGTLFGLFVHKPEVDLQRDSTPIGGYSGHADGQIGGNFTSSR